MSENEQRGRGGGLVFENELHDMTSTAKEALLADELPFQYDGDIIFEEVPYFGKRTDLVTARISEWDAARRRNLVGTLDPLPDERKYRKSYRELQRAGPITRSEWIHEDSTYRTEQTCREVWDWLAEHGYLRALRPEEAGGQAQLGSGVDVELTPLADDVPAIPVQVPDVVTLNAWELKPRDWETALRQAIRADCYADYRWVMMDAGGIDPTERDIQKEFSDAGVGLATLDNEELSVHVHPDRSNPPQTSTREMLNERALAEMSDETRAAIEAKHEEIKR